MESVDLPLLFGAGVCSSLALGCRIVGGGLDGLSLPSLPRCRYEEALGRAEKIGPELHHGVSLFDKIIGQVRSYNSSRWLMRHSLFRDCFCDVVTG